MHKEFKATYLYIIKAIMLFAAVITSFLVFNFLMMLLQAFIPIWLFYIINGVFVLFLLIFLFMQLTSKKPGLSLTTMDLNIKGSILNTTRLNVSAQHKAEVNQKSFSLTIQHTLLNYRGLLKKTDKKLNISLHQILDKWITYAQKNI